MANNGTMSFTIGGKRVSLSKNGIEDALKLARPEPVKKYSVRIGGVDFPIKQAVALAAKMPTAAFITTDAYRILTRLGFEVKS